MQPRLIAGRYQLEDLIGKGGMAEVWRARHLALNSYVAIKFLQGASAQNESTRRRFTTEAQVTAQLKSQHAVQVFDFGVTDEGQPYLVMELLEGETLGRRLEREGRLSVVDTARLLGQSARALHRAHQLGIVHRDFKPDNIVIGADDEGRDYVKVVDFGIAKLVGDLEPASQAPVAMDPSASARTPFTKTGAILGTPFYMAPEQVQNAADVDLRADIWAFGVVAFECLTGCTPFSGDTLFELFQRIARGEHPDADKLEPTVPPGFHEWFEIACAPAPAKRFGDAQTAWKKLLVALECGKVDLDPSIGRSMSLSGGAPIRPPIPLGDERVVLSSNAHAADENAVTMDAPLRRGGVEARQNRSVRGIPVAPKHSDSPPAPPPSELQTMSLAIAAPARPPTHDPLVETTVRRRVRPARRKRRGLDWMRTLVVAVPLLALVIVLGWRVLSSPAREPAPIPAHLAPAVTIASPLAPPAPSSPAASTASSASFPVSAPSAAAPPSATLAATAKSASPRARPSPAGSPSASALPATTPPSDEQNPVVAPLPRAPSPPPPTAPAATVADPSSYR